IEGVFLSEISSTKQRIFNSPNFIGGKAKNLQNTAIMVQNDEFKSNDKNEVRRMFFNPNDPKKVPSVKEDFKNEKGDYFAWLGHSSILFKFKNSTFLVDPLFDNSASPFPFVVSPFNGSSVFSVSDLPKIDYLIITHNHYDHLNRTTIKKLAKKGETKAVFVPLGVGKYLKSWGFDEAKIFEFDWNESLEIEQNLKIHCLSARHFSGRAIFDQRKSLWASFLIEFDDFKVFFGGDSGYGEHFKKFGEKFGKLDLAFLENGQYDSAWSQIHMFPSQTLQAAADLKTQILMPIHNSKYRISYHAWNAPLRDITKIYENSNFDFTLITPKIGQIVPLDLKNFRSEKWWE
ncbi:MAG: MBL fold metallo-hydrolase, partial [Campylobacter sp.]|nr:MBL fold metallo-hydrolase [Campylobacter sp.]